MMTFCNFKRQANLMGFNVCVSLYVDFERKEGEVTVKRDHVIVPIDFNQPEWWEIDTAEKAAAWFRKIDLDRLAELWWIEDAPRRIAAQRLLEEHRGY